jgi:starch-binding outer membrane protein SusE/F
MKKIFKISLFASILVFSLWSCKKDDHQIILKGGTAPVLTASDSGNIPLSINNKNAKALTLSWTNPDYQFSTGVSSLDVNYTIQIDTAGANFTSPDIQEKSIARDLSSVITVGELNTYLAKLGLVENISHNIEVRVKAALLNQSAPLYSNVIKFKAIPYLDVAVPLPVTGDLFLVGDATAGGWNNPVPEATQKFTKTSSTTYEITVPLIGGKEYLVLPKNGSWDHKYAVKDKSVAGLNEGGSFGYDLGDNFPGPVASGNYKITLDFKVGKFKVVKL